MSFDEASGMAVAAQAIGHRHGDSPGSSPTKLAVTGLTSQANEVAIDTIEAAHDGLALANG